MTIVRAFPRLHFGLADLGRTTPRAYGGAGVQLNGPSIDIEAIVEPTATLSGFERLDKRGQVDIAAAISRLEAAVPACPSFRIALLTEVYEHVGLGSKTAMTLGALQAAVIAGGVDLTRSEIQVLSGRGGASGVGVHAFFDGGFVMDAGHRQSEVPDLHPSAARRPTSAPLLVNRLEVPDDWRFCLALPAGKRLSGEDETGFFSSATPVPDEEVRATVAWLHHGIGPAFATGDMQALAESLEAIQGCGFKARELAAQPASVQALMDECRHVGPTGLSSMGPLVFVVVDSVAKEHEVSQVISRAGATDLGTWSARSTGFEVLG